jgi:elongation factor 3
MLTGETEPTEGTVTKHPNMRFAYVAQHAFHHLEEHLEKTPNEYIQWRFQNGTDKELMMKASRQMTEEDKKQMEKAVSFDGQKRQIKELRSRRKVKKTFEYEVEWVKMDSDEEFPWIMRDRLERWGFEKLLQQCDDREAAKANLAARPVTRGVIEKHYGEFGLPAEFATHSRMKGLSGGQKVKVVLAAAMWQNPHILVMDEPTNFLDRDSLGALATAIKKFGGGVVLISHNREFTQTVCSETWIVEGGKLKIEGEVAVDNNAEKIEQKLEEVSTDAFGNKVVTKVKRKLTRKERKQREKAKKEALKNGEDWESDSDFDE